jgi:hypothetical protein
MVALMQYAVNDVSPERKKTYASHHHAHTIIYKMVGDAFYCVILIYNITVHFGFRIQDFSSRIM